MVLREDLFDGIMPGDVLVRDDYLAIKAWSRDDVMTALQDKGYKGTEEQIDIVCENIIPDALSDCTDSDWEVIYDVIRSVRELLEESNEYAGANEEVKHMLMPIEADKLVRRLEEEVQAAQSFERNINNLLEAMKKAEDEKYIRSLADGIAFNKRMMELPLERASAMLEIVEFYNRENDLPTLALIGERLEAFKRFKEESDQPKEDASDTN